jgi:AraC-like DNA-binding protein
MSDPNGGHVGRRFFDAIQKNNLPEAAEYLTRMAQRHLDSPQSSEATLRVFLSAHLVSAFDLAGTLNIEQLAPVEEIVRQEAERLFPFCYTQPEQISVSINRILQKIAVTCGLAAAHASGRMEEVQRTIDERYADPNLSATRLAEEFGFSISYLSRTFKKAAGVGLNDYLHSVRISHAKELLRNTDLPIGDVAAQVGFSSASAFIRAYRAAEAITPGAYRERAQRLTGEK